MDDSKLTDLYQYLSSGILKGHRVSSIEATRKEGPLKGGTLSINTNATLSVSDDAPLTLSEVELEVRGIPENGTPDNCVFKIAIKVQCRYQWAELKREYLEGSASNYFLAKPPYLLCAAKAREIALSMGISNVKLPPDLMSAVAEAGHVEVLAPARKSQRAETPKALATTATKKPRVKKTT